MTIVENVILILILIILFLIYQMLRDIQSKMRKIIKFNERENFSDNSAQYITVNFNYDNKYISGSPFSLNPGHHFITLLPSMITVGGFDYDLHNLEVVVYFTNNKVQLHLTVLKATNLIVPDNQNIISIQMKSLKYNIPETQRVQLTALQCLNNSYYNSVRFDAMIKIQ